MSKIVGTLVGVIACLAASVVTALHRGSEPVLAEQGVAPRERADAIDLADPQPSVWIAVVVPVSEVVVTAPLSARLAAIEVHMGDAVLDGQIVATLDPQSVMHGADEAQARLHAREAQRRQAVAARAIARDKHGRADRLIGLVPEAELAEARLAVAAADADVDRAAAEARVERVEIEKSADALRDTTIRAPMSGEIAQRIAEPGTRLAAGDPIARIVDRRRMVRFAVPIDESPPALGAPLIVTCEDPVASSHAAVVAHVAPQIDGAARVVLVEAHLLAPAGTRIGAVCRARVQ